MAGTDVLKFHGLQTVLADSGPRTITVPSSSIIGLVDTFTPAADFALPDKPIKITNRREAAAAFGEGSAIYASCVDIFTRTSAVIAAIGVPVMADPAEQISRIIGGVSASGVRTGAQALLDCSTRLALHPRLLIAPGHTSHAAVATEFDALAEKLRALAIIDGPNTSDDDDAIAYARQFGSKNLFMVDCGGIERWDTRTSTTINRPPSAHAAAMFAWTDAQYGYWASPSNKPMVGITGTGRVDEYLENDETCRANLLNRAAISTVIRSPAGGFTLWGNRTLSADPKWSFVHRVRILYILMDAIQAGLRWAVDRSMSKTFVQDVSKSLEFFMADRRAEGAVIDFDVYPDPELNTQSSLSEGRLYLNVRFGDTPIAENPIIRFEVTNDYVTQLLD